MGPKGIYVPAEFLRYHRNRMALMQWELAERLGVKEARVRHLETGKLGGMRPNTFRRFADVLRTDVDGLREMIVQWESRKGIGPLIPPEGFAGVEPSESEPSPSPKPRNGDARPAPGEAKSPSGGNRPGRRKPRRSIQ